MNSEDEQRCGGGGGDIAHTTWSGTPLAASGRDGATRARARQRKVSRFNFMRQCSLPSAAAASSSTSTPAWATGTATDGERYVAVVEKRHSEDESLTLSPSPLGVSLACLPHGGHGFGSAIRIHLRGFFVPSFLPSFLPSFVSHSIKAEMCEIRYTWRLN